MKMSLGYDAINMSSRIQAGRERQKLENDLVHNWYQFVLSYPDHLIADMIDRLGITEGECVLDPFCGTGTTLVECKKRSINAVGIDANPSSIIASRIKTNWDIDPNSLEIMCDELVQTIRPISDNLALSDMPLFSLDNNSQIETLKSDILSDSRAGRYLIESGMIERGWIDEIPFYISIALLAQIDRLDVPSEYQQIFKLALAACMVESIANVRYGPEIYVVDNSGSHDVLGIFKDKVHAIANDLRIVKRTVTPGSTTVLAGDSRDCARVLQNAGIHSVDYVITSPPYPTEKDYTRNTRLELVYLGFVYDRQSLRRIKKQMVRSHSKGIYKSDSDGELVADLPYIKAIADELREKVKDKSYGFAKMYPRIIEEYFGGMYRHLLSLKEILQTGGKAAYVVGEQRTYLQTFTPTGTILATLAERPEVGYKHLDTTIWRVRQGTTGSGDTIKEEIVILEKQ